MKIVKKVWGEEHWIVNNKMYCGKKLILNKGYQCSYHHHKLKHETFYIESGMVKMEFQTATKYKEVCILCPSESIILSPNTNHRFIGLEDSVIFEFSTQHFDSDSYRLEPSGKVEL